MVNNLYLIGVLPLDPKGPERLERALDVIHPDIIGLEISRDDFYSVVEDRKKIERHICELKKKSPFSKENTSKLINLLNSCNYEYIVPDLYRQRNKDVILRYCLSTKKFNTGKIMIPLYNCKDKNLLNQFLNFYDLETEINRSDNLYNNFLGDENDNSTNYYNIIFSKRNQEIEKNIRKYVADSKNFVYIGNVRGIFGNFENLYERLYDLNPVRYKLNYFDDNNGLVMNENKNNKFKNVYFSYL